MRLLATLASQNVVEQIEETGRYRLGWRVLSYATAYQKANTLIQLSEAAVAQLAEMSGETCCLYVPAGSGRVVVLQVESPHELRYAAQVGRVYPLYRGAAGKALLAHMPQARIQRELDACGRDGGKESARRLSTDLTVIKARGFAISSGENIPGVCGIAVPIFGPAEVVVASLSVYGPLGRLDDAALKRLTQPVLAAGTDISRMLGERSVSLPDEAESDGATAPRRSTARAR